MNKNVSPKDDGLNFNDGWVKVYREATYGREWIEHHSPTEVTYWIRK